MKIKQFLISLFILLPIIAFADDNVRLEQSINRKNITIGDRIGYDIKVTLPDGNVLAVPEKKETLGEFTVKGTFLYIDKKDKSQHLMYALTAYTTGEIYVPELEVKYLDAEKKEKSLKAQPYKITIESVLSKIKGQPGLRDIAPPVNLKVPASVYLIWIGMLLLILAGAVAAYQIYMKKAGKTIENLPPPIPPDVIALEQLEKLRSSNLIKDGKIKEFYILLIDILRDYLSGIYGVDTRDKTTGEIFSELKRKEHDKKKLAFMREFLEAGDLVKFAKYRPDEKVCWEDFETARNIVTNKL